MWRFMCFICRVVVLIGIIRRVNLSILITVLRFHTIKDIVSRFATVETKDFTHVLPFSAIGEISCIPILMLMTIVAIVLVQMGVIMLVGWWSSAMPLA